MESGDAQLQHIDNHYNGFVKIEAMVAKDRIARCILAPKVELRDIS